MRGNANASVIDGFTMKNGYAKGATNEECHATGVSGVPACGGAVYVDQGATPTIQNNMIVSNVAVNEDSRTGVGGGIYAYESPGIKILNNEIYANSANSLDTGFGGAIYLNSCVSNPTIEGNNFWWNWATLSPNTGWGATIALEASGLVRIVNNHFYQNNPGGLSNLAGTAIYSLISSMIIRDNVFYDNYFGTVIYLAGGYTSMSGNYLTNPDANYGMQIVSAMVNMTNNIISDHKVGDVQIWGSADNFADLEFFYNTTASIDTEDTDYGIIIGDYVDGEFSYGIAANHYYGFYNAGHVIGEITISYYLMDGNIYNYADFTHTNDFTGNPLFVNPGNGDYHIQYGSAAINKGPGLTTVIIDIDHQRRPNYSYGWLNPADLGADEYCLPRYFPFIKK
jgi:hypothetical protein